ncbi:MAG: BamA/TamA family outer membrane protein, partial [Chitinophagaceae bacterium]
MLLLHAGLLRAQSYSLRLHGVDTNVATLAKLLPAFKEFNNQFSAYSFVKEIVPNLQEAGFLSASIDSLGSTKNNLDAFIYLGKKWRWARLSLKQVPPNIILGTGITEAQFANRDLTPKSISKLSEQILNWCENNGFPFATVGLDSIVSLENEVGIFARVSVVLNGVRRIDSLITEGNAQLAKPYLMRYLDIHEGNLYNESRLRSINKKLDNLSFLEPGSSWRVAFGLFDTKLRIKLKERRANQANLLIGLQPNTLQTGKFLLTADVQAAFQNLLGRGEAFSFSYQKLQAASPRIKAEALYPYLLGSPIGVDGHFDLYFNGTAYRKTTVDFGGRYALNAQDFIRLYYSGLTTRIINADTAFIVANHRLPDILDLSANGAGLEFQSDRTDYRFNPTKGYTVHLNGEVLNRTIRKNDGITGITDGSGFDYSKLYDSLSVATYQYQLSAQAAYYFPLRKHIVLKAFYAGAWISGDRLFQNELYQIGGIKMLRGFDEGSIFANQYHMLSAELRFLFARNSNFYLFSDNAWVQSKINGYANEGWYNGFGIGTQLEVKSGQ